jgi:hypothetical protein
MYRIWKWMSSKRRKNIFTPLQKATWLPEKPQLGWHIKIWKIAKLGVSKKLQCRVAQLVFYKWRFKFF